MSIATSEDFSLSNLSVNSQSSNEDWDRSESEIRVVGGQAKRTTPRNSVLFPGNGDEQRTPSRVGPHSGKRTLSELLKAYSEKGTDMQFSQEEATRVADVLGQWINSGSSPYEDDDDFFVRSQDDSSIFTKRSSSATSNGDDNATLGRPRGSSESMVNSRSTSRTAKP